MPSDKSDPSAWDVICPWSDSGKSYQLYQHVERGWKLDMVRCRWPAADGEFDSGTRQGDRALGQRAMENGASKLKSPLCLTAIGCNWPVATLRRTQGVLSSEGDGDGGGDGDGDFGGDGDSDFGGGGDDDFGGDGDGGDNGDGGDDDDVVDVADSAQQRLDDGQCRASGIEASDWRTSSSASYASVASHRQERAPHADRDSGNTTLAMSETTGTGAAGLDSAEHPCS